MLQFVSTNFNGNYFVFLPLNLDNNEYKVYLYIIGEKTYSVI